MLEKKRQREREIEKKIREEEMERKMNSMTNLRHLVFERKEKKLKVALTRKRNPTIFLIHFYPELARKNRISKPKWC